ncbi:MAG: succinate--CoA ligase subunit alpha [Chloroflexi bacterium]|nr:succinate--CoA ligase subunit alpha [Chloroflexota bacterium]
MSILIDNDTRLVVQGITGREGEFHARQMIAYGTKVVAGTNPVKGGQTVAGVPVFNMVKQAVAETGANTSIIYVPAFAAVDAILEAVDAGIKLVVCIAEGIPTLDMIEVVRFVKENGARLIGPNCPGLMTPGQCKVGIMPGHIAKPGKVGLVSRSGTLTYEVVKALSDLDLGQSTCVGIGGDPIIGTNFIDVLEMFQADPETEAIVMIGEIGGSDEEQAAEYIKKHVTKPMAGFIAGQTAPEGKRMGHAGAIISGGTGTAKEKIAAMTAAGVRMAESPPRVGAVMAEMLKG